MAQDLQGAKKPNSYLIDKPKTRSDGTFFILYNYKRGSRAGTGPCSFGMFENSEYIQEVYVFLEENFVEEN
jgi:hypothetical protein